MKHRIIKYKGYVIILTPYTARGIRGEVKEKQRPEYGVLYETSRFNSFETGSRDGEAPQQRSSLQSAKLVLSDCKHWIDRRVEIEQALDDLAVGGKSYG